MVYKNGLDVNNINWEANPIISKCSKSARILIRDIQYSKDDSLSDEVLMDISRYGKSKIKNLKRELKNAGLLVIQKTRAGFDYYVGYDAVNFYIGRYGATLDPTRVSLEYESREERVAREDFEINMIAYTELKKDGLLEVSMGIR